jgi:hypothetical protein
MENQSAAYWALTKAASMVEKLGNSSVVCWEKTMVALMVLRSEK